MFIWGNDIAVVISDRYIVLDCDCYQNCTIRDVICDIHYSMDGDAPPCKRGSASISAEQFTTKITK